jgi:hypothetical protein
MTWHFLRESVFVIATLASVGFLLSQRVTGTPASSPYSILVPANDIGAPITSGRVSKRRVSPCSWGERDVPTDFGWRCVPAL